MDTPGVRVYIGGMALKHWHPGTLVLFWVMCLLWSLVAVFVSTLLMDIPPDDSIAGLLRRSPSKRFVETLLLLAVPCLWLLAVLLVVTPFVVTMKWFTASEKRD